VRTVGLVKSNFNPELLAVKLNRTGDTAARKILAVMREEGDRIVEEARANAPVDDGELEDAIEAVENRSGANGRVVVTVQIDPSAVDNKGVPVIKYARVLHEALAPYGTGAFSLGPASRAKDGGGGKVGGKFMERAMRSRIGEMGKKVKQIVKESA
jgi:hypothetical protein